MYFFDPSLSVSIFPLVQNVFKQVPGATTFGFYACFSSGRVLAMADLYKKNKKTCIFNTKLFEVHTYGRTNHNKCHSREHTIAKLTIKFKRPLCLGDLSI